MQDTELVMIPNELIQSEIVQWIVGIFAGLAVLVSSFRGQKAAKANKGKPDETLFQLLKHFATLTADVDTVSKTISSLKNDLHELSESIKVMMEANRRTLDKVDSIETSVEILKDRG